MKISTILFLQLLSLNLLFAQPAGTSNFLIPYNDHGKWGWCDTLGKTVIQPEFESCTFFKYENDFWIGNVTKNNQQFIYISGKGQFPLAECGIAYNQSKELTNQNLWLICTKTNNRGLYDWSKQKLIIDTIMEPWSVDLENPGFIIYKTNNQPYSIFDLKKQKPVLSQMTESFWDGSMQKTYYRKSETSKEWFELSPKGVFVKSTHVVEEEYFAVGNEFMGEIFGDKEKEYFRYQATAINGIHLPEGYTPYSSIDIRNDTYVVFKKDNKFGLIKDSDKAIVIENKYDFVDIDYNTGYFFLMNEGKMGVKLLGTIYPAIEPKYEFIRMSQAMRINKTWSFVLFEVTLNGSKMYVGENGVEYFNL